jgi:putative ABC transport system substrate-binding protein
MMRRLSVIALHAAALVWVMGATLRAEAADAPGKVARIGYVGPGFASLSVKMKSAFRARLNELGWVEGQNLVVDEYWAEGHMERLPELMAAALARNPDVLVTGSTPGALAAKHATSTVPIVVGAMGDPVETGVVSNLARPGGNLTALSTGYTDGFAGKWLEVLLEAAPRSTRVAVIWNLGNPVVRGQGSDLQKVALTRGVKLQFIDVRNPDRLDQAFHQAKRAAQGAVVVCENLFIDNQQRVVKLAAKYRLPTMYCLSGFARSGGLMAYGVDLPAMFRRAADYVDKILRGAKAGDLPVEQPTKFELVVDLNTADALGLTIPQSILVRADEVIQ